MIRRLMLTGVLAVALGAGACATGPEPFEYESNNETKQGPGAFTGEEGSWTIYRQENPPEPQSVPTEETDGNDSEARPTGDNPKAPTGPAPE